MEGEGIPLQLLLLGTAGLTEFCKHWLAKKGFKFPTFCTIAMCFQPQGSLDFHFLIPVNSD